jgi:type II secretory pathway pseudopilin PulG
MNTPKINKKAFSLIEVVVAVGIFAIAIISVIGLLVPISNSVIGVREGDYASRLVTLAQSQIQSLGFDKLAGTNGYLDKPPLAGIYASMDGSKLGLGDNETLWGKDPATGTVNRKDQFFNIELTRNKDLSGLDGSNDADAGFLAFNMKVTWTVYNKGGQKVETPQLSTMIIPCAITR